MNLSRHLKPWPNHLFDCNRTEEQRRRISVHYNLYTPYHQGYLTLKENMVEDSVETGIKSPEPKGTKHRRESESHTVAMVITTPPPKWTGHYKERWVFDTGATAHITNNNRYMYNLRPTKQTISVANSTVYPVQSEGEVVLRSICGAIPTLKGVLYVPTAKNLLSSSKIVQNPKHRVEIDSVGTRIICNAGTRPTLNMNYDDAGELWYFIGARVSPTAQVNKEKPKVKRIYLDINESHQKFGHMSERMLKLTATRDNIVLTGKLQPCPA
jgi:hypothetical protein